MPIELIDERDFERDYRLDNGRVITLKLTDDYDEEAEISFWEEGKKIGDVFLFVEREFSTTPTYLLARMYCPIPRQGLGRAAVEMFIEHSGAKIITRPPHIGPLDDGSHLTEDAPGFVRRLQEAGLIEQWNLD